VVKKSFAKKHDKYKKYDAAESKISVRMLF